MAREQQQPISPLVLDEYFAAGDARFLPALKQFHDPKKLAALADRWKRDHRPWARQQIFAYLDEPLDALGHETVVKRLFKHAEEKDDVELMAAFAVGFDHFVRRVLRKKTHYDWQTRQVWREDKLVSPQDTLPHVGKQPGTPPRDSRPIEVKNTQSWRGAAGTLFTYHTRYYLRRRAWRYFRRKGHRKPNEYCAAVAGFLRRYTDGMLGSGSSLLDSWSLMHACFRESELLDFRHPSKVNVRPGANFASLVAAPDFLDLWKERPSAKVLASLLTTANSRAMRVWAIQLLRRDHVEHFSDFTADEILALLDHPDEEVQTIGAEMLERSTNLAGLELEIWLKLLRTRNLAALEIIGRLMAQHVRADQLTLEQTVELTNAAPVPVARLGLSFLKSRKIESAAERSAIARLSAARSAGVAGAITAWALSILGAAEHYDVDAVTRFFDSLLVEARDAAWAWLIAPESAGYNDPSLWSRLIETPYDDVRFHVVRELERRAKLPGTSIGQIAVIWTTVLLNIHRGGRSKLTALKQISRAIADDPQHAEPLLPVLSVAIRSVRLPEVRTGLSAIVAAVESHPDLAAAVAKHLPEMQLSSEAAV